MNLFSVVSWNIETLIELLCYSFMLSMLPFFSQCFLLIPLKTWENQKLSNLFRGSRHPEVFSKKDVLKTFAKFTGKHLCQSLFFNKVATATATLLKKRLWHRCFSVNFVKFLRTLFLTEHLRWLLLRIGKKRVKHFYITFLRVLFLDIFLFLSYTSFFWISKIHKATFKVLFNYFLLFVCFLGGRIYLEKNVFNFAVTMRCANNAQNVNNKFPLLVILL